MRIACCSLLLVVASCSTARPPNATALPSGGWFVETAKPHSTLLEVHTAGGERREVVLQCDDTVRADAMVERVEVIGEVGSSGLIVSDTYLSPHGASYCGAGEERYLRIINLGSTPPVITFSRKLESCVENLELQERGLAWNPGSSLLQIRWLSGPNGPGVSSDLCFKVDSKMNAVNIACSATSAPR